MKKLLAMIMVLAMLLVSAASAEAAYSYAEYNYDETMFAEVGGEWMAIPELGLQFYVMDIYTAIEVPEALAAVGGVAAFATADGVGAMVVSYGPTVDADGNVIETIEDEAAYLASIGSTNVDIIYVNGLPVITALSADGETLNYCLFYGDGTQCVFSFSPASDANIALTAGLFITSLMAAE